MRKQELELLTVKQVAKKTRAGASSVRLWAKKGMLAGAQLIEPPAGIPYWMIPAAALDGFKLRVRGRPPKPKAESNKKAKSSKRGRKG